MKSIYNAGDKVYLPEEDDFIDYEIVEVTPEESDGRPEDQFRYKIRPVNGQRTMVKSESEILPIIFC